MPFLLPPGIFVTLLGLLGLWSLVRRRVSCGCLNLLLCALLWASSSGPAAAWLMKGLEAPYYALPEPRGDVIVLLGGGIAEGAPDLSGVGAPLDEMTARLVTAVRLQKKLGTPVIVSGGKLFEHQAAEAPVVRRFLADLGVPPGKILVEERSRNTHENAMNSARICREQGFRAPVVVTSAYHMRRAMLCFERAGMKATPFPSPFRSWPGRVFTRLDYLPAGSALVRTGDAVKEYLGYAVYRVVY